MVTGCFFLRLLGTASATILFRHWAKLKSRKMYFWVAFRRITNKSNSYFQTCVTVCYFCCRFTCKVDVGAVSMSERGQTYSEKQFLFQSRRRMKAELFQFSEELNSDDYCQKFWLNLKFSFSGKILWRVEKPLAARDSFLHDECQIKSTRVGFAQSLSQIEKERDENDLNLQNQYRSVNCDYR